MLHLLRLACKRQATNSSLKNVLTHHSMNHLVLYKTCSHFISHTFCSTSCNVATSYCYSNSISDTENPLRLNILSTVY